MPDLLETLRQIALERSRQYPTDYFLLRGLWRIDYRYRPNVWERDLAYSMVLAHTVWQGCCYVDYATPKIDDTLLGRDARDLRPEDIGTAIAVLDAIYAVFDKRPKATFTFQGMASDKTSLRARIITSEVTKVLRRCGGNRVLNVGVMGNFIKQLRDDGVEVVGSDFDDTIIGTRVNDAAVENGERTLELIKDFDVILATGMTLTTQTLDDIISTVKRYGRKLILFAATGAHFGEEYCRTFGVDVVLSEVQPQYMFQGPSTIHIFERDA